MLLQSTIVSPPLQNMGNEELRETVIIVMLGPPGVGKGTQAAFLYEDLQIPHISTGDLLRGNIKNNTAPGKVAKTYMDKGALVPDDLILDMLFDRVAKEDCKRGYILDGFPRTIAQAEAYHARLSRGCKVIALNLKLSDREIVKRITQRITCGNCGSVYHLIYSPPKEPRKCDKCLSPLMQRVDDREDVVMERLKVYRDQTSPLITFYENKSSIYHVSCEGSKEKIYQEILSHLIFLQPLTNL